MLSIIVLSVVVVAVGTPIVHKIVNKNEDNSNYPTGTAVVTA